MILNKLDDEIIGSPMKQIAFSIKASKKAFKGLSDTLYTHKIRAIIRELSCNAVDAHRLVNNKADFDITFPTLIDPSFVIRDYGPGLSYDDIIEIFTVYFESTKEESNDFTGALGLGAKSPFSYGSRSFTVVSWHNNMKSTYNMMLHAGEPICSVVSNIKSDEPSGVQITVMSEEDDVDTWRSEAAVVYRAFDDIRPNFINYELAVNYYPTDVDTFTDAQNHCRAVMGNVEYPIPTTMTKDRLFTKFNQYPVFRFPLGSLDFTLSREQLSLDEATIDALNARFDDYERHYVESIQSAIDACEHRRDVAEYVRNRGYNIASYIKNNMCYKGQLVNDLIEELRPRIEDAFVRCFTTSPAGGGNVAIRKRRLKQTVRWRDGANSIAIDDVLGSKIKHIDVLVIDIKSGYTIAMQNLVDQLKPDTVFVVEADSLGLKFLTDLFPGDESTIHYASKYHSTQKIKREKRPVSPNVTKWDISPSDIKTSELNMTASEIRELKGVMVRSYCNDRVNREGNIIYNITKIMRAAGLESVYIVRPTAYKYAEQSDMIEFEDFINEYIHEELSKINFAKSVFLSRYTYKQMDVLTAYGLFKELPYTPIENDALERLRIIARDLRCNDTLAVIDEKLELIRANDEVMIAEYTEFMSKNPVISAALSSGIKLSDEVIDDFFKIVK